MIDKQLIDFLPLERKKELFAKNDEFEARWRPSFRKPDQIGHAIVDISGTFAHLEKLGILTLEEIPTFLEMYIQLHALASPYLVESRELEKATKAFQAGAQA